MPYDTAATAPTRTPAQRAARSALDAHEHEFFQRCRARPDGQGLYQRDSERIERIALAIHRAATEVVGLYARLETARDHERSDGTTVTLQVRLEDLHQRFADSVELGEEAAALLGAQLAAYRATPFLCDFGCGPGVDPEAAANGVFQ